MGPAFEGVRRREDGPMVVPKLPSVTNEPKTWNEQYFQTGHPKTSCFCLRLALGYTYTYIIQITDFTDDIAMKKVSATEASKAFGQLVDDVQSESVTIERNGRPVAVVYSYDEAQRIEAMREAHLDALIQEGINAADEGRIRPLTQNVKDEILTNARQRYEELSQ